MRYSVSPERTVYVARQDEGGTVVTGAGVTVEVTGVEVAVTGVAVVVVGMGVGGGGADTVN